ncbi:MAG: DNA/RNA nuclease SfsA [bacterium]
MRGYLLRRYQRFKVDIETEAGQIITAYCPATGRLTTCYRTTAPVEYFPMENSNRTLRYDWWSIRMPESWVVIDTRCANQKVYSQRNCSWFPEQLRSAEWLSEPAEPDLFEGRLDYQLEWETGKPGFMEIKSVSMARDRVGYFPDAPTKRGRRHLRSLLELARNGYPVFVVLASMRGDIEEVRPCRETDPEFSDLLEQCSRNGVQIYALSAKVGPTNLTFTGTIPVVF